ncbi:hypothetical protein PSTT_04747 [Puccinia striiformis]|uniref:Uncharacterized protein n=1 Tax=Puccinia striiformis TaxID=27350 RepID=A0A2S4VRP5_9BASI|nr:hypothetical protein PSTT_04747 [Puccinia striiformis]
MNFKLSSIIEPIEEPDKDNPPHMEPKPMIKEHIAKEESHEHKIPQQCAPIRNLEPTNPITEDWEVTFPKLDHGLIDLDLRRELWRGIPKTTEWEVFSGQMPYNHELWIKQIDVYAKDYLMLDAMVVSRLTTCMSGSAKLWYISHRVGNENKTWAWWKNAIENKYGTESWKRKLREEFDADRFHLNNPKIHEWFTTQKERLRGFSPELSNYIICQKILKQCPGPLIHAVKSRYKKPDEKMTFEEMVIIVEGS